MVRCGVSLSFAGRDTFDFAEFTATIVSDDVGTILAVNSAKSKVSVEDARQPACFCDVVTDFDANAIVGEKSAWERNPPGS